VTIVLWVVSILVSLAFAAFVIGAFVWAAKKDGEEDQATQRRLGFRRKTRLGL
jgi:hypothetical protein